MADRFWRFYDKANAIVRTFTGPAQVGIGRPEAPEVRPSDPGLPDLPPADVAAPDRAIRRPAHTYPDALSRLSWLRLSWLRQCGRVARETATRAGESRARPLPARHHHDGHARGVQHLRRHSAQEHSTGRPITARSDDEEVDIRRLEV